jgi:hypothetical protein
MGLEDESDAVDAMQLRMMAQKKRKNAGSGED